MRAPMTDDEADTIATTLDARGLACPEPVLRLRAALRDLPVGAVVCVLTTDALAHVDIAAFCLRGGHELLRTQGPAENRRFVVRKGAGRRHDPA
jgi:tRNA 2-thiouridine synthesizing protein A